MRKKKLLAGLLVAAMSVSLLAGCGAKDSTQTPDTTTPTDAASEGGDATTDPAVDTSLYPGTAEANAITVNIASEPPELFTVTTTDTTSFTVIRHVMENLVMLGDNDEVIPGVATDWNVSDDQLTYTFNLRKDMKWSNGEPVTANDFVFAWKSLLTPSFGAEYAYFGYLFKNGEAYNKGEVSADELGFKALDDYTLEVTLENPTSYFLSTLAFGVFAPLNEKAYNEFGDAYGTDADKIVTNGAFNLSTWEHENNIVLTKNPDYWDADSISLDKITMVMINDTNAALNAFKAGEVDIIGLSGDQTALLNSEGYPTLAYDDGSSWYLEFNTTDKYLSNQNLRTAITYAIDKQSFVDSIVKNDSKPATSFTPPAMAGLNGKFHEEVGELVPVFDVEKAKKYYAKALEELGTDKVEITMISDDSDTAVLYAAFIQEQLKVNLGIEITVESMPFKSRLERMTNKDFSMVFAGWGPDYNDPMTFLDMFETGNGNNHTSYSNPAYDELLDKVRKETDPATRFGYLYELEKTLMTDLPIGPVYWRARNYVVSGKIASGVVRTAFQDMDYARVKLK